MHAKRCVNAEVRKEHVSVFSRARPYVRHTVALRFTPYSSLTLTLNQSITGM